jgi:hypothetical protein
MKHSTEVAMYKIVNALIVALIVSTMIASVGTIV